MLSFDPHRWLAERDPALTCSSFSRLAGLATSRSVVQSSGTEEPPAKVAKAAKALDCESSILRDWHARLAPLDFDRAPDGFTLSRWRQLHGDSWWIYENFASRAVRDGWSGYDLFGVFVPHPGWGGLCDRLLGARNLKMARCKAVWSRWGVPDWTCVGAGDSLVSSGLKLIWELPTIGE